MKFLPGIPLFLGAFTRRCEIGGGGGVRLGILIGISLFWAMAPRGILQIEVFVLSRGREGSGLDFSRDPLVLDRTQVPYLEGRISPFLLCPWSRWAG